MNETRNGFRLVSQWICSKWDRSKCCASLWAYFILAIFIFGCIGIWGTLLFKDFISDKAYLFAILSSSWAISAASCADFIFFEQENYVRSIPIFGVVILLVLSIFSISLSSSCICFIISICCAFICLLLAFSLWWLANADKLKDETNPMASVGGDASSCVSGNEGEFKL